MSKTPKEFVKDKLNEKTGQGTTLYEHYLAHDTTVSIGTVVSWMEEYASLSQPIGKTDELISKLISSLEYQIKEIKVLHDTMDEVSWNDQQGVIITGIEAEFIISKLTGHVDNEPISSLKEQIKKEETLPSDAKEDKLKGIIREVIWQYCYGKGSTDALFNYKDIEDVTHDIIELYFQPE
jgi:hypothetical protein